MKMVTLGNRPETLPPRTKLYDFTLADGKYARVSVKLLNSDSDFITLDFQAFEVTKSGVFVSAPDGRASRTSGTQSNVLTSSVGDTHTLQPGWVRVVGNYNADTFDETAVQGKGKPSNDSPPDLDTNLNGQYFDTESGIGYRWDATGEVERIARDKAEELQRIIRNSNPLSGIDF